MRLSIFAPFLSSFVQASGENLCLGDADKGATTISLSSDESFCRLRPRDDAPHKVRLKMAGLSDTSSCTEDEDRIFITSNGSLLGPLCPKVHEKHILDWFGREDEDEQSIYDAIFDATETTMIFVPGNKVEANGQKVIITVAWENMSARPASSPRQPKSIGSMMEESSVSPVSLCPISNFASDFVRTAKAKLAKEPKKIVRKMGIKLTELYENFEEDHRDFCQEDALKVNCDIFEANDGGSQLGIFTALSDIVKHISPECSSTFVNGFKDDLEELRELLGFEKIEETTEFLTTTEDFTTTSPLTTTETTPIPITTTSSEPTTTSTTTTTTSTTSTTTTTTTSTSTSTSTTTTSTTSTTTTTTTTSTTTTTTTAPPTSTTDFTTSTTQTTDYTTTDSYTTTNSQSTTSTNAPTTILPTEITTQPLPYSSKIRESSDFSRPFAVSRGDSIHSDKMCKIRNMPERFNTIFSARANELRPKDMKIVKRAVVTISKSFKYCDRSHVLCDLIDLNRKMHGCQLIKSLTNMMDYLAAEGTCEVDWLNDVASKIESAQMVFGEESMKNCLGTDENWDLRELKEMDEDFFRGEKKTLQEALAEVSKRQLPLNHRSWVSKIRLTLKSALAALGNKEDTLIISDVDICAVSVEQLEAHAGTIFTRFLDSVRGDSGASEEAVKTMSGMMARVLRKFRQKNRNSQEIKVECNDLRVQRSLRTNFIDMADSVYRMIRLNNHP